MLATGYNKESKTVDPILSPAFVESYRNKPVPWGFGALSYITYKRTYSQLKDDGTYEEWVDTLERCINGAQKIGAEYTREEAERLFDHMFNLRCIYAGRYLWQLGTGTVDKLGGASLNNCTFSTVKSIEDFCYIMDSLMLGIGIGASVRRQDVAELPKVKKAVSVQHERTNDADFIVPDSRSGWVELLRQVLTAFLKTGKSLTYSTILVRSAGEPIKTFGGIASGPKILVDGIEKIVKVLQSREGKKLRSIDALDIINIIGSIVVAGNVRRSAQVIMGDPDDYLFLHAKDWHSGKIPNWRAFSNNTIYADNAEYLTDDFWKTYQQTGEPLGLFNLQLSQTQGRLGEYINDSSVEGSNACLEVSLADKELCNLGELALNNIQSLDMLIDCAKLLYKTQKACTSLPYHHEDTTKIVRRNRRLGMSVTGTVQALDNLNWLDPAYNELKKFDIQWSADHGIPASIKLTSQKPSGTVSLLTGSTPGIHPAYSEYYIRRVRIASDHALVQYVIDHGYSVEYARNFDGSDDRGTKIISFPCHIPNAVYAKDMSAVSQLELVKKMQTVWADNAVSVTVYFRDHELDSIKAWLTENYETSVKAVSFLRHNDHGFDQAPYEEITKEQYESMISVIKPLVPFHDYIELDDAECATGSCPVR